MSDRTSFLMKSRSNKSCGPAARSKSTSNDFGVVQQRAEQAAKFFHSVGLANGDLPRETKNSRPGSLSLSGTPTKIHGDNVSIQSPSRRQSPLVFSPTNSYSSAGVSFSRPMSSSNVNQIIKDDATFKSKVQQRNARHTLYKSPDRTVLHTSDENTVVVSHPLAESETCQEVSRKFKTPNSETKQRPEERYFNSPSHCKDNDQSETNVNKVKSDPNRTCNSLSRVRSHLYDKQRSQDRSIKDKSTLNDCNTITSEHSLKQILDGNTPTHSHISEPATFERLLTGSSNESSPSKSPSLQRHRSSSDSHSDVFVSEPKSSQSYDFTDGKFFMKHISKSFASTSSLSEVEKRESLSSHMSSFTSEHQKHDIGTPPRSLSPASKLFKKSPSHTPRTSPNTHRRFRGKHRSKSDVPEHKVVLNRMQSEGDVQALLRQEELVDEQERKRRHHFAHYDWQSMLFSFQDVLVAMETLKRKITLSGASQAAALVSSPSLDNLASKGSSVSGSQEDISMYLEEDEGLADNKFNDLVASCPFFRNEVGGEADRVVCVSASSNLTVQVGNHEDASTKEAQNILTNHTFLSIVENDNSDQAGASNPPPTGCMSFGIELVDSGATYYRTHFFDKEHQNFVGVDERHGPIVISLRRERLEDEGYGAVYQYRIIVRTCELCTLRGSILEDVIQSQRYQSSKGIPAKAVLEYVCPEINVSCLKVAAATPKVNEQLMKVDEQNLHEAYKMGILYCQAGQISEEDMYSNEHGSKAFNQFLALIGDKVKLCGFEDYRGGLDVKADSTGTESVFTTFQGHKIMFHVSTLLPFSSNNKQQVLRKRHIGNDITTIVFQEPGSEPFNPKHVRSHFQHIFVIVRVHNPCSDNTCYSVAVTRSRNIPRFGPPIPEDSMFPSSSTFRDFLLTKLINGENTACTTGKFKALAMNTRAQYLSDLGNLTQTGLEGNSRFGRFSITASSRRNKESKDKSPKVVKPEYLSYGALTWHICVDDYCFSEKVSCILGMSECFLMLVEKATKRMIFSIPCQAVLGWTVPPPSQEQLRTFRRVLFVYYGRGERITLYTNDVDSRDEITLRLERFTKGSETMNRALRRGVNDQLEFRVNYEGIVAEVQPNSNASVDGLKQSSRLVEICKVPVVTKTHEEIIHLLKTADPLKVVVVPPNDDGTPRKCSMDLYHLYPVLEFKKVDLSSALTLDISHSRGESEPMRRVSERSKRVRSENEDVQSFHAAKHRPEESTLHSPPTGKPPDLCPLEILDLYPRDDVMMGNSCLPSTFSRYFRQMYDSSVIHNHSPKVKVQQPVLKKTGSLDDTEATLTATASRLALVGVTSGYVNKRARSKGFRERQPNVDNSTSIMSSPTSINGNGKDDAGKLESCNSYSFQPSMNSNNNSSRIRVSSHCNAFSSSNQESTPNCSCDSRVFLRNANNNNNNSISQGPLLQSRKTWNENILIDLQKVSLKSTFNRSHFFNSRSSSFSRNTPVNKYTEPKFKKSFRHRSFSHTPMTSHNSINAFQNSLIPTPPFESYSESVSFNQISSSTWSLQKGNKKSSHKRQPSLLIQPTVLLPITPLKERIRRVQIDEDVIARQMNNESTISASSDERQGFNEFDSVSMKRFYNFDQTSSDPMDRRQCSRATLPVKYVHDHINRDRVGLRSLRSPPYHARLGVMSYSPLMGLLAKTKYQGTSRRRKTVSAV